MPRAEPFCALENPEETIATYGSCAVIVQKWAYTKGALLLVPDEPRSTLEADDLKTAWQFARQHPDRALWYSGLGSGGTQVHVHVQAHRRTELGGALPIAQSGRTELLRLPGTSVGVARIEGYPLPGLSVTCTDDRDLDLAVHVASVCMAELHCPFNCVIPHAGELLIVGRAKEIPTGWDPKKFGGAEVAGVLVFNQAPPALTFEKVQAALVDVGLSPAQQAAWEARVRHRLARPGAVRPPTRPRLRLVVLDIEGVLTPAGANEAWDWPRLGALRCLLEGLPIAGALCSGRQVSFGEALLYYLNLLRPLPEVLGARFAAHFGRALRGWPSILENGAFFFDPLARMALTYPPLAANAELQGAFRDVRRRVEELRQTTGAELEPGKMWCLSLNPPFVPGGETRVPIADFAALVMDKLSTYQRQGYIAITHSVSAVDITPAGVSKAAAIAFLLAASGLAPAEVLGVGDSEADAAWLGLVGTRATPANGSAALDPLLHYRSLYPTVTGTLDILQRLA